MPAKELSTDQRAEAASLKVRFRAFQAERKAAGQPWQQDELADELGFGQSALSQYLNGIIPLNWPVVEKFAELLGIPEGEISPTVVQMVREQQAKVDAFLQRAAAKRAPATSTGKKKS